MVRTGHYRDASSRANEVTFEGLLSREGPPEQKIVAG